MSYVTVKIMMPADPEDPTKLVEREMNINQDAVLFVIKPSVLPDGIVVTRDTQMKVKNPRDFTLPSFDLPDGGTCWIGPRHVIFWHETEQLGLYVIGMPGQNQAIVKSTKQELCTKLGLIETPKSNIIGA